MRVTTVIAIASAVLLLCGPAQGGERVVIELNDGARVEGEVLKKDDKVVHLSIGDNVLSIERESIKEMKSATGSSEDLKDVKESELYRTAELAVKAVPALAEDLGPAIVVVKTPMGSGTGWFCTPDGYVVTNNHVIAGEQSISVTAFKREDGRFEKKVYKKVRLVALDEHMDLALLKVEEDLGMEIPQLYVGDSDHVKEGDEVFTIGNPMGLERSTGTGNVSKAKRNYEGRLYIQTTTPTAPGNSGGPLFNERGEIVGVVNMGYIFLDGLGFAIPSRYVKEFLDNVEAFAFDPDNPNSGVKYMEAPLAATDDSIKFTESDLIKTGHGISCLTLADVNSDGIDEAVFVNNNKGEIGILRLRREGEEEEQAADFEDINRLPDSERFKLDTHAVNNRISALAVHDMNDDGRLDILFHGDIDAVSVLEQEEDGSFAPPRKIADTEVTKRTDALKVIDLDGDGRDEVFALGGEEVAVIREGEEPETFPLSAGYRDNIRDFELTDVNGDGRPDVVFFSADKFYAAHALLQNPEGQFVEENLIPSHLSGPVKPYRDGAGGRTFLTLDKGQNRIRHLTLESRRQPVRPGHVNVAVSATPIDSAAGTAGDFEVADLNGDGRIDLLTVNKAKNEFLIYEATEHGRRLHRSPAPKSVSGLRLFQTADGKAVLFSFSADDKIFGLSRVTATGVTFPRPINTEGQVQFLRLGDLDGEATLVWVEKLEKDYVIRAAAAGPLAAEAFDGERGSIEVEPRTLLFGEGDKEPQERLSGKLVDLAFADFDLDGRADLIIYWTYSHKESLYLGLGDGRFKGIIVDQEFLEQQAGQPLLVADVDGDGKGDVLLVQPGFVRVLRVDDRSKLYTEQQFNWDFGEVSRLVTYGQDQPPRFLALAQAAAKIIEFDADNSRTVLVGTVDLKGLEPGDLKIADMDGDGTLDIVIMGRNAIQTVYRRDEHRTLQSKIVFDTKLDYFTYWNIYPADLDGEGGDEVLLFDSKKAMLEIHRPGEDGQLHPICRHRIFERSIHQMGETDSYELPQELAVGDVDGNGKADLVFVLQDRLAIYLQGRPDAAEGRDAD